VRIRRCPAVALIVDRELLAIAVIGLAGPRRRNCNCLELRSVGGW
jgi:hypothetical protein